MKELSIRFLDAFGWAWWVKIATDKPSCTYYFGPFLTKQDANKAQPGYIEDLKSEGAQGIVIETRRCQPRELTIFDELNEEADFKPVPAFSSQS